MDKFFLICFGVGAGYTIFSFLLGEIFNVIDLDSDFDISGHISPMKPTVIAAFITVFGGVGFILNRSFGLLVTLPTAVFAALVISFVLYRYVIVPLYRAQNTSAVEKQSLIGCSAKVSEYIPKGKFGKITYYANSNTYTAPARSEDGEEIKRNDSVEIVYIEKHVFYVRRSEDEKRSPVTQNQ